jgi:hypothetical protein
MQRATPVDSTEPRKDKTSCDLIIPTSCTY